MVEQLDMFAASVENTVVENKENLNLTGRQLALYELILKNSLTYERTQESEKQKRRLCLGQSEAGAVSKSFKVL